MLVSSVDIEGWTSQGRKVPLVSQSDCLLQPALEAFHRLHPEATTLRVIVCFSTVVAAEQLR